MCFYSGGRAGKEVRTPHFIPLMLRCVAFYDWRSGPSFYSGRSCSLKSRFFFPFFRISVFFSNFGNVPDRLRTPIFRFYAKNATQKWWKCLDWTSLKPFYGHHQSQTRFWRSERSFYSNLAVSQDPSPDGFLRPK